MLFWKVNFNYNERIHFSPFYYRDKYFVFQRDGFFFGKKIRNIDVYDTSKYGWIIWLYCNFANAHGT